MLKFSTEFEMSIGYFIFCPENIINFTISIGPKISVNVGFATRFSTIVNSLILTLIQKKK